MYNLSGYDNATNLLTMLDASNDLSNGLYFSIVFLLVGFVILFIILKNRYDTVVSMMGSSFIIGIVGVMGFVLGLVPRNIVFLPIFLVLASIIIYMLQD